MNDTRVTAWKIWDIPSRDGLGNLTPSSRGLEVHPDLIRFKDWFYCLWNENNGKRIMRSPDAKIWETVLLGRVGQMFAHTPRGGLMTVGTGRLPSMEGDGTSQRQSFTLFSRDGFNWGLPGIHPGGADCVLYRVTWHESTAYSVAYNGKDKDGTLYRSTNGCAWEVHKPDFFPPGRQGNEGDLAFAADGTAYCLLRGGFGAPVSIGRAFPDYREWEWTVPTVDGYQDGREGPADRELRAPFGGPKFLRLKDGRLLAYGRVLGPLPGHERRQADDAASRFAHELLERRQTKAGIAPASARGAGGDRNDPLKRDEHATVTVFAFDPAANRLTRLADFPGFSHYCGMVEHEDALWIACGRADSGWEVWMLRVALDALPFPREPGH